MHISYDWHVSAFSKKNKFFPKNFCFKEFLHLDFSEFSENKVEFFPFLKISIAYYCREDRDNY